MADGFWSCWLLAKQNLKSSVFDEYKKAEHGKKEAKSLALFAFYEAGPS